MNTFLAGVHQADSGTMLLDGTPYRPANPRQAAARGIAVVFQELSLCNNLTVAENILATREPARYGIINRKALYRRARELVQDLNLPIDVEARVADLSIAQRQLVEIAKGLSHDARVIILDEPTSSLSDAEAEILFAIIARLKAAGKAVIYISHRMEEIMRLSDAITVMRDGEYIATLPREKTTVDELIRLMVGRRMEQMYPPRLPQTPATDGVPAMISDSNWQAIGASSFLGLPLIIWILLILFLANHIALSMTVFGRQTYLTGGNREAALYSGIRVNRIKIIIFTLSGIMSAIAGILLSSRLYSAQTNAGLSYELDAIAAAVLGGTSLSGGVGTMPGTLIGALIIGVLNNGMNMLSVPYFYQLIVKGAVILVAVWLDVRAKQRKD